jgi:hypothetical protein
MEGRSVTRFTAVFYVNESQHIGPVRSARLINLYLTPQYGGALVASGAGNEVRWALKNQMGVPYLDIDIDDPSNNVFIWTMGTYWETRMHTSTERLRRWLAKWQAEQDPQLRGFAFEPGAPQGGSGRSAMIAFPSVVAWTYDDTSGRYLRSSGGVPHVDATTQEQLGAANVVIQTVRHEATNIVVDAYGNTLIRIIPSGEGRVTVLRDGVSVSGTWRTAGAGMPEFFDETGKSIALKPGNTWFEIVAATDKVTIE